MLSRILFKIIENHLDQYLINFINNNLINLSTEKQYLLILPERLQISERDLNDIFAKLTGKINMIIIQSDQFRLIEFDINSTKK